MGDTFVIVVNDYKNIKEVFSRDEFDGRVTNVDFLKDRAFGKELGKETVCSLSDTYAIYNSLMKRYLVFLFRDRKHLMR